jgi:hypothetical protein
MMKQQNGQASQTHAGPIKIGKQIGPQKLFLIQQESKDCHGNSGHANEETITLPSRDPVGNWVYRCHC